MPPFEPLDFDRLRRRLEASSIGHTVHYAPVLPSTMPVAADLVREPNCRSGLVVVAEEQTAGRGRQRRSWVVPPGRGLLVSIGLKPPHLRLPATHLPVAAGLATLDALAAAAPSLRRQLSLKWPNDVLLGPRPLEAGKVAGILVETSMTPDGALDYAVLGFGINVNQTAEELPPAEPPAPPPTSLRLALGVPVDRTDVLVHLCRALEGRLALSPDLLFADWRAHLSTLGQRVAVYTTGEPAAAIAGLAVDVDTYGALVVQDDDGRRHLCRAGDVSLRPVT